MNIDVDVIRSLDLMNTYNKLLFMSLRILSKIGK